LTSLPPLHGIPLAIKDLFDLAAAPTTAGSRLFGKVAAEDAAVIARLRLAGAVFVGKTNLHEIALGVTNVNPHYGPCRNPWDLSRISGGSSGGSAAAVAAGMCLGALGSDTGGSIRIPAALCGVTGLKPTYGRVSLRGAIPLSWNLDHVGPLARTAYDIAILLQALAGYDPADPACAGQPVPDYLAEIEGGVSGWKVALAAGDYLVANTAPPVWEAVQRAAAVFAGLGAAVETVRLDWLEEAARANGLMVTSDAAAFYAECMASRRQDFGADVLERLESGAARTSGEYSRARRLQIMLRRRAEVFFDAYRLLLTPTTPYPAPALEGSDAIAQARQLTRFTAAFNFTGLPALTIPCGFDANGLPIGLQLIARPWDEAGLLQAAHAYQQVTGWHVQTPAILERGS
jgi:aspartyl-tRNA(Asn)/glutamyl-tRNA(Gln) amidotransferase subunit A